MSPPATSLIWRVTTPAGHRQIDLIPAVTGRSVHIDVDGQRIPATLRKPTAKEPVTEGTFVIDGMSLTFVLRRLRRGNAAGDLAGELIGVVK